MNDPNFTRQKPQDIRQPSNEEASPVPSNPAQSPDAFQPLVLNDDNKPPRNKWKKRVLLIVTVLLIFVLAAGISAYVWYTSSLKAIDEKSDEKVKVVVEEGMGPSMIAEALQRAGVIRSSDAFSWYVRLNGSAGSLQSGTYRLGKSEDVPTIVKHLTSGKTDTFSITFLPGDTLEKHRETLIEAGYEPSVVDAALSKSYDYPIFDTKPANADLEGYIYGETYQFASNATPEQILDRTFEQLQSVVDQNDLVKRYESRGFTLYEGITLASIIQREVITKQDMAQISQIFQLRLKRDMQLGSDVTYQYIADKTGVARDVNLDSPYNTRRYGGLPPGPIASPGVDALVSVAAPASGDYLYFLSGDDDKTYYGKTVEEHETNIRNHCQKKCQII